MPSASQDAPGSNLGIDRASNTIRLTRDFDSPRAEIFEAWTKPEHVTRWWDAAGDPLAVCEIDLRPGGSFRFVTRGRPDLPFAGVYREIAPPDRLIFEALGSTGRVLIREADGRTHRMRLQRTTRSVPQDGRQRRHGPDARQPRRLHAQPSVEGCLKADRATPPSLRPSGQPRGVAIQGT
jgi:uncharacterized protein YndB with AHSA1/START domain